MFSSIVFGGPPCFQRWEPLYYRTWNRITINFVDNTSKWFDSTLHHMLSSEFKAFKIDRDFRIFIKLNCNLSFFNAFVTNKKPTTNKSLYFFIISKLFIYLTLLMWSQKCYYLKIDSTYSLSVYVSIVKRTIVFGWGCDNKTLCISNTKLKGCHLKYMKYTAVIAQNHKQKVITNIQYYSQKSHLKVQQILETNKSNVFLMI